MTATIPYRQGEGEPLVLIHGFTDSWRGWSPITPILSQHHEVFAWSLPGHFDGEPLDPTVPFSLHVIADSVVHQMEELGLAKAHLVGNSLGGWLALYLAGQGRALSVTAVCPALGWEPRGADEDRVLKWFLRTKADIGRGRRMLPFVARHPTLRRLALRDLVADGRKVSTVDCAALFESMTTCTVVDAAVAEGRVVNLPELGPFDCPVRVLWGSKDRIIRWPACYTRMRRELPDAEWIRLDGLGHLPMWDDPELISRLILEETGALLT